MPIYDPTCPTHLQKPRQNHDPNTPHGKAVLGPAVPNDTMATVAGTLLAQVGLTLSNVWLTSDDYATTTHFGNWVLVPVRGDGTRVDLHRTLIEASDIAVLQEGQRVTLHHDTTFGGWRQDEGRILRKGSRQAYDHLIPYVTILAKGKRKLGWEIRAGDYAAIVPWENSRA